MAGHSFQKDRGRLLAEMLVLGGIGAVAGATAIWLARQVRQAGQRRGAARAGYFDACLLLFADPVKGQTPSGFARVSGTYRGRRFDLQALPDTLTFRKLPALWLMVTIPAPMPVAATLDVMQRPIGTETFSHFGTLPVQLGSPPGLPPEAVVRTDDPHGLPVESIVMAHLEVFGTPRVKELVISPKGLRIVWLAEEADRGRYLLFRDAEMGAEALPPATLRPLLDRLVDLARDLEQQGAAKQAATG